MKDCVKARKNAFIVLDLIQQHPKPRHIHEQKILEFKKCRNHLTIGEARRIYAQSSKTNYSDAAKPTRQLKHRRNRKSKSREYCSKHYD
ncbi:hypothetical protein CEXT_579971 [Caerostris extrusa]|uniref:Uncharacterized protein n=1 Tax=Caerostris extrusa TaxID=172846 RepID=A0AAV4UQ12_CAEEX|nr:hypothetical protein CEXT_579971 [Caerostris extrusa]